jgi:hypothetical protein
MPLQDQRLHVQRPRGPWAKELGDMEMDAFFEVWKKTCGKNWQNPDLSLGRWKTFRFCEDGSDFSCLFHGRSRYLRDEHGSNLRLRGSLKGYKTSGNAAGRFQDVHPIFWH